MRLLPILLTLLLAGPAWAQTDRGVVDHIDNHTSYTCNAARAGHRIWCLADGQEETCDGAAGNWTATGPGAGGTVTDVFGCDGSATPDCNIIDAKASSALDFSVGETLNAIADGTAFVLPTDTAVNCVTSVTATEGSLCSAVNTAQVMMGNDASYQDIGGDVRTIFGCESGDCLLVDVNDDNYLDFQGGTMNVSNNIEGLHLPGSPANCGNSGDGESEGQICWDGTNDELYIGTGNNSSRNISYRHECMLVNDARIGVIAGALHPTLWLHGKPVNIVGGWCICDNATTCTATMQFKFEQSDGTDMAELVTCDGTLDAIATDNDLAAYEELRMVPHTTDPDGDGDDWMICWQWQDAST